MKNILTENLTLGNNVHIESTASIRGLNGLAKNIIIGDNVYIGHNVQIICDDFSLGDYSKIQHDCNIHGYKPCSIGHNAWIGQFSIIDSIGGAKIGNNCGIGAHSQLWSHIKFGDTLEGCKFLDEKETKIGNDVWFVGHCIVSPITAYDKSMAMAGSVITKTMEYNQIYAGSPAKSISDKIGFQFDNISIENKYAKLTSYLDEFNSIQSTSPRIRVVKTSSEVNFNDDITYFVVDERKYKKTGSPQEVEFMKFLLPAKAKFTPIIHDTI